MDALLPISLGAILGAAIAAALAVMWKRAQDKAVNQVLKDARDQTERQFSGSITEMKDAFSALSRAALSANNDDFLRLAKENLDKKTMEADQLLETKKKLIDARLGEVTRKLEELNTIIQTADKQRAESQGVIKGQLEKMTQATNRLQDTTGQLREALASPKRRGQWGERMAEDVLRLAGFVEGVNYVKQQRLPNGNVPDITFLLPGERFVHMDVKFPLTNYLKLLDEEDEGARKVHTTNFLKDVRLRLKEVTTRGYIDPAAGTLDYVLVFIPVEQTFGFIQEHDRSLLDFALSNKVILCSPLTLYAILAIIRQSIDTFRLERASSEVLTLLADFRSQWSKYTESMDKVGKRLEETMRAYSEVVGVRTRQLDRRLDKIDDLGIVREQSSSAAELPAPLVASQVTKPGQAGSED